ncbi:hypothetical protein RclHR1_05300012 [Rhizophagus clarus]|uniref:Uncharacterized protein n=1 Tax=Rhizophagus clarus TaxID=94130 RepID=A0A2Z6RNC1_9GLOM|nr:hypothetical protein RclHR1_05300012 [Rhizophagus clarus]GET03614.1 hypothetical protein GLOIN_2v1483579 [Rhizophagus clarus]
MSEQNKKLRSLDEIVDDILGLVVGTNAELVRKLWEYKIYWNERQVYNYLCRRRAREGRVAAPGPEPITRVTYNNPATLITPFDPSSVLPLPDYSKYEQNYVIFPVMEPVPNNFPNSFERAIKSSSFQK